MLQNVQMALDFLRFKKIKLVNIRAEDIVDRKYRFQAKCVSQISGGVLNGEFLIFPRWFSVEIPTQILLKSLPSPHR